MVWHVASPRFPAWTPWVWRVGMRRWDSFERRVLDPDRLRSLPQLQRALLRNGFRLLRPGGMLVYSTCSLTRAQNEDVVGWLLEQELDAEVVPAMPRSPPAPPPQQPPPLRPWSLGAAVSPNDTPLALTTVVETASATAAADASSCTSSGPASAAAVDAPATGSATGRPAVVAAATADAAAGATSDGAAGGAAALVPFGAREGALPHTLYFSPQQSGTSGLFLAKIRKRLKRVRAS